MERAVFNIVEAWTNVYLKGSEEEARALFLEGKYDDRATNPVNLATLPDGIDWNNYIIETIIDKCEVINDNQYEIFFRLDVNMQFEGSITNCDYMKFLMHAELKNSELKIVGVRELACYPWELDEFYVREANFGKVYLAPGVSTTLESLEEIISNAVSDLQAMFESSYLSDLSIVVFPSSQCLCEFLQIKCDWGEIGGKAKGDHIFIVYSNREHCRRAIQHEISHIALERVIEYCKCNYSILPCIYEALAEMASLSFDYNNIRKMYNSILKVDDLSLSDLEDLFVQTVRERSNQILAAVSLLHYIQSIHGIKGVLDFILKSALLGSLTHAVKNVTEQDVIPFEEKWRIFVKG